MFLFLCISLKNYFSSLRTYIFFQYLKPVTSYKIYTLGLIYEMLETMERSQFTSLKSSKPKANFFLFFFYRAA